MIEQRPLERPQLPIVTPLVPSEKETVPVALAVLTGLRGLAGLF